MEKNLKKPYIVAERLSEFKMPHEVTTKYIIVRERKYVV